MLRKLSVPGCEWAHATSAGVVQICSVTLHDAAGSSEKRRDKRLCSMRIYGGQYRHGGVRLIAAIVVLWPAAAKVAPGRPFRLRLDIVYVSS